jgi:hypothetical protein
VAESNYPEDPVLVLREDDPDLYLVVLKTIRSIPNDASSFPGVIRTVRFTIESDYRWMIF